MRLEHSSDLDGLLNVVCGEFASRLGVERPDFLGPVADYLGPAWLRDAIASSGPEEWAWAFSVITPGAGCRERGAVSTLPSLARLMCRLALQECGRFDASISIVDPAVGSGAFVLAMAAELAGAARGEGIGVAACGDAGDLRRWAIGRVRGVDLNESCVRAAKATAWLWSLAGWNGVGSWEPPRVNLFVGDSLLENDEWWSSGPGEPGAFDVFMANPPYVRQELMGPGSKAALAKKYAGLGGRTDVYARFFMLAARLLRPGGVGVFVTPVSWMDVAYGLRVKQFLVDNFEIKSVLISGETRWFPQASINAGITVLRKRRDASRAGSTVCFTSMGANGATTVAVPQASLKPSEKWGVYLRAPRVYFNLMNDLMDDLVKDTAGGGRPGFCRLLDLATVSFGTKTGANDFFYLRDVSDTPEGRRLLAPAGRGQLAGVRAMKSVGRGERVPAALIEAEFLRPVVKSLRDVKGYRVNPRDLNLWGLVTDPGGAGECLDGAGFASNYLRLGEEMGYASRPTCKNRRPWHRIPGPPADMLYSMSWGSRMGVPLNCPGCLYDARLYGIRARDGVDPLELAAALNATSTWLFTEVTGRPMTGSLPLLDIKIYEVERLPVLDLRRLDRGARESLAGQMRVLLSRDMLDITREVELEDRRRLDVAVLSMAGYATPKAEIIAAEIGECVAAMVRQRISKSRRVLC